MGARVECSHIRGALGDSDGDMFEFCRSAHFPGTRMRRIAIAMFKMFQRMILQ
jgi:hypothetical protein